MAQETISPGTQGHCKVQELVPYRIASISGYRICNKYDYCIKIEYRGKNKRVYEANVPTSPAITRT